MPQVTESNPVLNHAYQRTVSVLGEVRELLVESQKTNWNSSHTRKLMALEATLYADKVELSEMKTTPARKVGSYPL